MSGQADEAGRGRRDIIAIPTHNRIRMLVACLNCLRQAKGLENWRIFIRDDASSEYGPAEIARLIPEAERIDQNADRLGQDLSQIRLFRDCIAAGARRILVLDSDMLVSPSMLDFAARTFGRTDGFLGLYNSTLHVKRGDYDAELIEKWSAGGTTTLWDADLLGRVVDRCERLNAETGRIYAWDYAAVQELHQSGVRVLVSRRSWAQHLGISGANNGHFGRIDYGRDFVIETDEQARFMADTLDYLLANQKSFLYRRKRLWRILDRLSVLWR